MALRKQYFRLNCFIPPNYLNQYRIAWLMRAKGVCKIVEVGDVLPVELNQNVARFKAGLRSGRAIANISKADALGRFIEVRDAAESRTVA